MSGLCPRKVRRRVGRARAAACVGLLAILSACRSDHSNESQPSDVAVVVHGDTVPACATCRLDLEPTAILRDSTTLTPLGLVVVRDKSGRYYVTGTREAFGTVLLFDSTGAPIRQIGRRGAGPGEFAQVSALFVGPGDSLYVIHDNRLSVFDSSGGFARGFRFEHLVETPQIVHVAARGITLSAFTLGALRNSIAYPLATYDNAGRLTRRFGPPGSLGRLDSATGAGTAGKRPAASAGGGRVWLRDIGYLFERVDSVGQVERVLGVVTPRSWNLPLQVNIEQLVALSHGSTRGRAAESSAPSTGPRMSRPPSVRIADFGMLNDSLLMVIVHIPAADWQPAEQRVDPATVGDSDDGPRLLPRSREREFDSMIDLINTNSGRLTSRTAVEGQLRLTNDGTVYRASLSPDGILSIETFVLVPRWG